MGFLSGFEIPEWIWRLQVGSRVDLGEAQVVPRQVLIDIDGKHEWRDCIDVPGVRLPRGYYFGTSSVTGDLSGTAWRGPGGAPRWI